MFLGGHFHPRGRAAEHTALCDSRLDMISGNRGVEAQAR